MKKLSLLVGTLGGAMAGYLFSNKELREALSKAKDPEAAAKLLGKHLQKDGKKVAKEVQEFVESDDVQQNLNKAKKFAKEKADQAKKELDVLVGKGKKKAVKTVKKTAKKAKATAKRTTKKAKSTAKKVAKKK